jgi:lactose/L-arabinose transport system permease protein
MNEGAVSKNLKKIGTYAFLIIMSIISVFPLYWCLISATNTSLEVNAGKMIPGTHLIENMKNLFSQYDVATAMKNSFVNSILLTLCALIICSLAGYGFEIYHDKYKDGVMNILLLAMMVPFVAILIPLFQMFSKMGLLSSPIAFMLPSISTPFLIMMFRNNARTFPHEIIEAARVDGLNEVQIFIRMFVPTMKPTYAAATTITFMNAWNSYLWPKVILTSTKAKTMPMLISDTVAGYVLDYGMIMAGVVICTLPTIIIFFVLQNSFTEAIAGSVK